MNAIPILPALDMEAGRPRPARPMRVALVNLPWALADRPSIQCGLLKARLVQDEHDVDVHYLNLDLAAKLGANLYHTISEAGQKRLIMLGEWLFTVTAFGQGSPDSAYHDEFPAVDELCAEAGLTFEDLSNLRHKVLPEWLHATVSRVDWSSYDLVGLSSTFDQQVAVLAAVADIKRQAPQVPIVVGGANVDGEMGPEYLRCFTDIDYVVVGEGDEALPQLVAELSHGRDPEPVVGVCRRDATGAVKPAVSRPVRNLDRLPVPDYADYFRTLEAVGGHNVLDGRKVKLLAEFSRGCWWGEKHHCTFCGLNGLGMEYRSKSPKRAVEEILQLAGLWQVLTIDAVDNILDMQYVATLCDELAPHGYDLSLFFEVKVNLTAKQLAQLRSAGVKVIQPGIESLSSNVLRIMDKGSDMLMNIRFLKWARQYFIHVAWNLLTGFPGETDADYLDQVALIPALYHLQPPTGMSDVWLERFSPLYKSPPATFHDVRPAEAYSLIYPPGQVDIAKIAYFFNHRSETAVTDAARTALREAVDRWGRRWKPGVRVPTLFYEQGPGWIRVADGRGQSPTEVVYEGWRASAFVGCNETPRTASALSRQLAALGTPPPAEAEVAEFLAECAERWLMATERGRYLSLAHSVPRYT